MHDWALLSFRPPTNWSPQTPTHRLHWYPVSFKSSGVIFAVWAALVCVQTLHGTINKRQKSAFLFLNHFPNLYSQKFSNLPHGNQGWCFWSLLMTFWKGTSWTVPLSITLRTMQLLSFCGLGSGEVPLPLSPKERCSKHPSHFPSPRLSYPAKTAWVL